MTTCEQSQQNDSVQMELIPSTSFVAVSPASRFPLPGSSEARTITATSGRKCSALCRSSSPLGSLVKMLLASSVWHSQRCVLTWKAQGMKCNRLLFRLVPSMPSTEETGSGFWPTPMQPNNGGSNGKAKLKTMLFPTPDCSDRRSAKSKQQGLSNAVKLMATPTAQDAKNSTLPASQLNRDSVPGNLLQQGQTGQLNPLFVEWLMGFPEGWTDLNA